MKLQTSLGLFLFGAGVLSPLAARAQYNDYNISSGSDCTIQDYRTVKGAEGSYLDIGQ